MAQFIATSVTVPTPVAAFNVPIGFTPGRIELLNLSKAASTTNGVIKKAVWQTGMAQGTAIVTQVANPPAQAPDFTTFVAANGISTIIPPYQARYGAVISNFTNAANGVITVDNTQDFGFQIGDQVRVADLADDQTGTGGLNGDYIVMAVTSTSVTVTASTVGKAVYVSGGFLSIVNKINATPPPTFIPYVVKNLAFFGFSIGTGALTGASGGDILLVSCWDSNVVF